MARAAALSGTELCQALQETYEVNERMNQIFLEQLDSHAWRAKAPGRNTRTIAAILAHVQLGFPLPAKAAYEIWTWESFGSNAGLWDRAEPQIGIGDGLK